MAKRWIAACAAVLLLAGCGAVAEPASIPENEAAPDETGLPQYQYLTEAEWRALREQRRTYSSMASEQRLLAHKAGEFPCERFEHLWWEETIDNHLVSFVGKQRFGDWIKQRQAAGQCADIYHFADAFDIGIEELVALLEEHELGEVYELDRMENRYHALADNAITIS